MEKTQFQFISSRYGSNGDLDYDMGKLHIMSLDIETECEGGFPDPNTAIERVTLITFYHDGKYYSYGIKPYTESFDETGVEVDYTYCASEKDLFESFLADYAMFRPHIITGWNIEGFDLPYLINRMKYVFGTDSKKKISMLSPIGFVRTDCKNMRGFEIYGVDILDYMNLYKKFTFVMRESYRLDYIAEVEIGQKKLSYDEYDSIMSFYKHDWNKFVRYNIIDVKLINQLEEKLRLIELVVSIAYSARVNFEDTLYQTRIWDSIIYHHLASKKVVVPLMNKTNKDDQYEGAYVSDPTPGMYEWIVSVDVASLYPNLIRTFNISPDTIRGVDSSFAGEDSVDRLLGMLKTNPNMNARMKEHGVCMAANGSLYRTDITGFLPELMTKFYHVRKEHKKKAGEYKALAINESDPIKKKEYETKAKIYGVSELARKISINSAYGAIGNQGFRFYDLREAEGITRSGKLTIRWAGMCIDDYLNKILNTEKKKYVIYQDTDSCYIDCSGIVEKFGKDKPTNDIVDMLDKFFSDKIQPFLNKIFKALGDRMNCPTMTIEMDRECIADRGIWIAKKKYLLNVLDNSGIRKTKLKTMGVEIVRSSTPSVCRQELKDCAEIILRGTNDELRSRIQEFNPKFMSLPPEDIAFPRGVNDLGKYRDDKQLFKKGTPIHVKAALAYNKLVDDFDLSLKYSKIKDQDKIRFLYLKSANPCGTNAIAFINSLPREFDIHDYIDYNMQYEKAFMQPLTNITNLIGWNVGESESLF